MSNTILKCFVTQVATQRIEDKAHIEHIPAYVKAQGDDLPALLIIGKEGAEPRVFSEEDVRTILGSIAKDIVRQHDDTGTERWTNSALHSIQYFCSKHGIKLP